MAIYTEEFKRSIVKKVLLRSEIPLRRQAQEHGIAPSTINGWLKKYTNIQNVGNASKKWPKDWTLEERFNILLETNNLTDEPLGAYCRQKGIYPHQLAQWRETFMQSKTEGKQSQELAELRALRAENKALKKELNRKDKALAETSALLILKKKAAFLWGGSEED
jgi:transposase